ncbi:hypothetical protein BX600DRAFT_504443 [Xylariales sp. PMI_506]|nr:hypothetical protein BX600DRAFT_504443 [Xylariales sp. PMI_506]
MPNYAIFIVDSNRPYIDKTKEDEDIEKSPLAQKMLREFIAWTDTEVKAGRIQGGDFLLKSSAETNVRVEFSNPDEAPAAEQGRNGDDDNNDGTTLLRKDPQAIPEGNDHSTTTTIIGYYNAEFPTIKEAVSWAQSCPISYEGFAIEIRQLQDSETALNNAPSELKEWAGDQIVSVRKQKLEEGKMRKDEDGTLWAKVEDDGVVKEIINDAEKRDVQNDHN